MSALDLGYLVEIRFKGEWGDTFTFLIRAACARLRLTLVVTGQVGFGILGGDQIQRRVG